MIRVILPLLALVLAHAPVPSWAAQPNAEQAGAIVQIGGSPPKLPAASEVRKWSDKELLAALEERKVGGEDELLLAEVVRRGGDGWKKYLASREEVLERLLQTPLSDPLEKHSLRDGI